MPLVIRELHRPRTPSTLNEEWLLLENTGPGPINAHGCALTVARGRATIGRTRSARSIPASCCSRTRRSASSPARRRRRRRARRPTRRTIKNYHLFLREPVLERPGMVVRVALKQLELARAVFAARRARTASASE